MIAPPRVASPGRTRARSRHKEQQQRPRAQTDWMSFGAALEASGRSASPVDRQPIPQHFTPATTQAPVQQQPPQQDDFLGIFSSPPQPSSVPNATTEPPPQNLPFSAPMVSQSPPSAPLSAPTAAGGNPFRQSSYGGGMEWDTPSAEDAPPAPPRPGEDDEPKKKKKKKKKEGRGRSKTVGSKATSPRAPPPHPAPPPPATEDDDDLNAAAAEAPPLPKKKLKEIDVLPLLHTGVMLVKFKMTGGGRGKSKRFHITPDNKFLCWEGTKFAKSAEDRQVFLGDIQEVTELDASAVSGARLKNPQWAMSIIYNQKGQSKTLNLCAQTQFHYQMIYRALEKLSEDAKPEHLHPVTHQTVGGRDLAAMFELFLKFPKDVLPEHLRKQKFKWEAVPEGELNARADESRERAMTTPIGHDGTGMSVNVQYPGSEQVPTANHEQIMQRDRAFSAGLAGAR